MSTSVASVISHFPDAENGFTSTTAGSVASGATTVALNSTGGYTNGMPVVLVIDPSDAAKKQTFTGIVDTAGVQITNVVWTAGTDQTHALGATVVDYATATHIAMMSKGILVGHTQEGYSKTLLDTNGKEWIKQTATGSAVNELTVANAATGNAPTLSATGDDTNIDLNITPKGTGGIKLNKRFDGWVDGCLPAPDTITNNGQRSYDLVFNGVDYTNRISEGMRLKLTRTVAAPIKCADLESSSSQYFNRATGDLSAGFGSITSVFTAMGWVKLESYGAVCGVISRIDANDGWDLSVLADGTIKANGRTTAAGTDSVASYQSIPLNRWVHIAAVFEISSSANSKIYIDGILVPTTFTNGADGAIGVPAVALEVGARIGGSFFDGKLAQVAVFSSKLSEATIRSYASQGLSGSETDLLAGFSLSDDITDLSANNNDLTAQGSAVATNADSPFALSSSGVPTGTTDYAIVMAKSFSTNTTLTVQVPEGCTIPTSGGISAVSYSTQDTPYGFRGSYQSIASAKSFIGSLSTTTSTSFANLADAVAQSVTVPIIHGQALVSISGNSYNSSAEIRTNISFEVSGATTISALESLGTDLINRETSTTSGVDNTLTTIVDLNNGSNTFTLKYKTQSNTATVAKRMISVTPL